MSHTFIVWIDEFKRVKDDHPRGVLIASIMEEYRKDAWVEIVEVALTVTMVPDRLIFWAAVVMRREPSAEAKAVI